MKPDRLSAVQKWARDFEYVADEGDVWTIPDMDKPKGDCEDLALGAAYILAGKSIPRMLWMILTRQIGLVTGDSLYSGDRHAALRYRRLWIDTGHRYWSTSPRLDGAKRVSFSRLLRELGYGRHMRIGAVALLALAVLLFAQAVRAEAGVNLSGTTITLREGWEAPYEIEFANMGDNVHSENGVYGLTLPGLSVSVDYVLLGPWGGDDRIVVSVPDGWVCEPVDCTLYLPERTTDVIRLHRAKAGM